MLSFFSCFFFVSNSFHFCSCIFLFSVFCKVCFHHFFSFLLILFFFLLKKPLPIQTTCNLIHCLVLLIMCIVLYCIALHCIVLHCIVCMYLCMWARISTAPSTQSSQLEPRIRFCALRLRKRNGESCQTLFKEIWSSLWFGSCEDLSTSLACAASNSKTDKPCYLIYLPSPDEKLQELTWGTDYFCGCSSSVPRSQAISPDIRRGMRIIRSCLPCKFDQAR